MEQLATPATRSAPSALAGGSTQQATRLLTVAVQQHQAGQLDTAERHYRDVLRLVADQPDALHLLGVEPPVLMSGKDLRRTHPGL